MSAKTPADRKREQRARDKLAEEERLARLLARTIKVEIYKATDYALIRCMVRAGIEEPQDLLTRLIHGADRLDDAELEELVSLPSRHGVTAWRHERIIEGIHMKAIDLFAGAGGFSTGATMAGCDVVWAANHWPDAVEWHAINHPDAQHVCQDLHQARWELVPSHDIMLVSPCCQGHSKARGKASGNPQHDASRSTAWAVVSAAEYHRPEFILVENVPEFLDWQLYRPWELAMQALGYSVAPHVIDAADHGAPQNRVRMFLVLAKSAAPLHLNLQPQQHIPARSFIDLGAGNWSQIDKPGRAKNTLARVAAGRAEHGDTFLMSYYGNTMTGRSLDRPIGTITTRDRWAIVQGDRMRMLSRWECRDAMSFPADYQLPDNHRLAVHLLGNAVCPVPVSKIITELKRAA